MTDFKIKSDTRAAFDFSSNTLASLATSSGLVAGRSSASLVTVSSSLRPMDYNITGNLVTNASTAPTAGGRLQVWVVPKGSNWPNPFGGSNVSVTVDSVEQLNGYGFLVTSQVNTAATNEKFYFSKSLVAVCGFVPDEFVIWVVHNTGQNLHATGSNHVIEYQALYLNGT